MSATKDKKRPAAKPRAVVASTDLDDDVVLRRATRPTVIAETPGSAILPTSDPEALEPAPTGVVPDAKPQGSTGQARPRRDPWTGPRFESALNPTGVLDADAIRRRYHRAIDAIIDQPPAFGLVRVPAVSRARLLAARIGAMADGLALAAPTPEGLADAESLAEELGINAAWRDVHGLKASLHEQHARLMLIDAIDMVAPAVHKLRTGQDVTAIIEQYPPDPPQVFHVSHMEPDSIAGLVAVVHGYYGSLFPIEAARLDDAKVIVAIDAWKEGGGRPRRGTVSKWGAIRDLLVTADLAKPETDTRWLTQQWAKYIEQARARWLPRPVTFK